MTDAGSAAGLPDVIRLGTRRSALAMAQSGMVARDLEAVTGRRVELVQIVSEGDTTRASLASLGGTGVFATRLREALLAGECDLLVHSLKDLPTAPAPGLVIAATPRRADARDVIITRDGTRLEDLPAGSRVGTGSPRRIAQVRAANPGVEIHDLRGNVDSRMARVRDGELDAIVLAAAGLSRLGADIDLHVEPRDLVAWPTAAGQGVLAVETRADAAPALLEALRRLDDPVTRYAQEVERTILAGIEAGCHAPVGVHAFLDGDRMRVRADVLGADPAQTVATDEDVLIGTISAAGAEGYSRDSGSADGDAPGATPRASDIGHEIARRLLAAGASELISGPSTL
ncbi:hydroxymethylbilane synthase [Microbacterium sediminis]|uniref:Hydroxymethylbilane synthase n=1 Tax=Microbacterium sediminis TaxID=904291 RepID=A0A1B9N9J5_9MICO|nr:hydroxymethylbilane synthase [Microbacterium sediminis]OCG73260.1 hydroxymethylbilane synthase [Microbacterium sediminis]